MIVIRVDGKPRDEDTHTWSDYLELLALINLDRVCGHEFALDRLSDSPEDDSLADDDDDEYDEPDERAQEDTFSLKRSRAREKASIRLVDAFSLCQWRSAAYGHRYPYEVNLSSREIRLRDELTEAHYSYLFLLLCGNQPFIKKEKNALTDGFEKFCAFVFSQVVPQGSEVHVYGKAAVTRYKGNKLEKLKALCADLRGRLIANPQAFRKGDNGDSGIDIVAWHGLNDEAMNIPVSLAQCACSREDWVKKQAEILPDFFANHMTTNPPWVPFMFIPICFRSASGTWAYSGEVKNVVLMDRLRILKNCSDFRAANDACTAKKLVRAAFGSEEVV